MYKNKINYSSTYPLIHTSQNTLHKNPIKHNALIDDFQILSSELLTNFRVRSFKLFIFTFKEIKYCFIMIHKLLTSWLPSKKNKIVMLIFSNFLKCRKRMIFQTSYNKKLLHNNLLNRNIILDSINYNFVLYCIISIKLYYFKICFDCS